MSGFLEFCGNWYLLFFVLSFILGAGVCGYIIDDKANVIEIDQKKKELLERNRDMSVIKTQFKDKTLSFSGLEDKPSGVASGNTAPADANQGTEEDLSAPLNLNL